MLKKLSTFAQENEMNEPHLRRLIAEGLFPAVRLGRRLYVHVETAEEWARNGGAALPGGWRRIPAEKQAAR